ncbi:MAG: hypothetical protein PHN31_02815 [Candidatus Gracilibacteria bacterium]|nr:hypothetical protein [Candidatus Gracilibacteria bacterium]
MNLKFEGQQDFKAPEVSNLGKEIVNIIDLIKEDLLGILEQIKNKFQTKN